jgi:succinate dehydrogenase hydrophobic anchor subunit
MLQQAAEGLLIHAYCCGHISSAELLQRHAYAGHQQQVSRWHLVQQTVWTVQLLLLLVVASCHIVAGAAVVVGCLVVSAVGVLASLAPLRLG